VERDVVPRWPVKNALDLTRIDGLIGIDPVGNFREVAGPNILLVEEDRFVSDVFSSLAARAVAHAALQGACAVPDVIGSWSVYVVFCEGKGSARATVIACVL